MQTTRLLTTVLLLASACGDDSDTQQPPSDASGPMDLAVCRQASATLEAGCSSLNQSSPILIDPLESRTVDASGFTWIHTFVGPVSPVPPYFAAARATMTATRAADGMKIAELIDAPMMSSTWFGPIVTAAFSFEICGPLTKVGTTITVRVTFTANEFTLMRSYDLTVDCLGDAACLAMCS